MFSALLLVSASLWSQAASSASAPSAAELQAEVQRLVAELDDRSLAVRDRAQQRLVELGLDVLPLLPAITSRTPAESKARLGRIRRILEANWSASVSRAAEVTLRGEMPVAEAMQAITEQTGNKLVGYEQASGKIQVDFGGAPFWPVLDQVLDMSGFGIDPNGGEPNTLVLVPLDDSSVPRFGRAAYSGMFRFEPVRIEAQRDLRNPAANVLRLTIEVAWEPRMTPVALRQPIDAIIAVDEEGNRIVAGGTGSDPVLNASGESGLSVLELGIPLGLPVRGNAQIKSLRGTLTALVPGRLESFEFTDLERARDVEQRRAGVTVILEQVRRNGDLYEVRIRIHYDEAANAFESHRGWIYANPAYLLNRDGERLESLGANEGGRGENEIGLALLFDLPHGPQGCKFVYQTPTSLMRLSVPYELKDIALP